MRTTPKAPAIQIQSRDLDMLRGLFESRVMTGVHISALYFDGKQEAAKKRIHKLAAAGLIAKRPRRTFEPAIYFLARAGLLTLRDYGALRDYPDLSLPSLERRARVSDLTIRHELETMDVKAALCRALKSAHVRVEEFTTWPLLNRFSIEASSNQQADVRPDAFLRLASDDPKRPCRSFYVEIDRSTEAQTTLTSRTAAYLEYYRSGGFAVRSGGTRQDFRRFPFRVLLVLKTAERRNNTIERLLECVPPVLSQVWLTTFADLTGDPLGSIWIRPVDYREAVAGTEFNIRHTQSLQYARHPRRDAFIDAVVPKHHLLDASPKEKATVSGRAHLST